MAIRKLIHFYSLIKYNYLVGHYIIAIVDYCNIIIYTICVMINDKSRKYLYYL